MSFWVSLAQILISNPGRESLAELVNKVSCLAEQIAGWEAGDDTILHEDLLTLKADLAL